MSNTTTRYDTLVIRGSTSKEVPREAAGGKLFLGRLATHLLNRDHWKSSSVTSSMGISAA